MRRLTLQGPSAPVPARRARLRVDPVPRRFRFALSKLGSTGRSAGTSAAAGASGSVSPRRPNRRVPRPRPLPRPARRLADGRHRQARGGSGAERRPPAGGLARGHLAGRQPVGLRPRRLPRHAGTTPQGAGRPPLPGRASAPAPPPGRCSSSWTAAPRLRPDQRRGARPPPRPVAQQRPGAAIAATARWVPRVLRDGCGGGSRRKASAGLVRGRVAAGTVALVGGRLENPSPPRPDDLFGGRTSVRRLDPPAPLNHQEDRLRVFAGTDRLFGDFSRLEVSTSLPDDAELLSPRDARRSARRSWPTASARAR